MQGVSNISVRNRLGVDLGTLVTLAVQTPTSGATNEISSAVALGNDGFVVGADAEQVLAAQPARGARQLKRRFGDTTPIVLDGDAIQSDALLGELLRAVVATSGIDTSTATLALTHPASWRGYKLELLRTIGTSLGFADVELISEPVAAARRYASSDRISSGDTVAVYDLGGTFDAGIVSISESGPSLVGTPQTLERFGGAEIDQLVFTHVTNALGGALEELDRNDDEVRRAVTLLRSACTQAKHELSTKSEASVSVVVPGLDTSVRMTRDEFETALRPYITETLQTLDRAISAAGMTPGDLAGVILSGGGSRIPLVAEMVAGHLGRPVLNDFDPKLVVASGAAETIAAPSSQPFTSIADTASASPRETIMSDQTTPPADPAPAAPAAGRSTPPPPPAAKKRGPSKAAKIVGGAAAAAAAVAAGVMYGDDIVDAASGNDDTGAAAAGQPGQPGSADDGAGDGPVETADRRERETTDYDSMDAFDATGPSDAAVVTEPVAGPLGTPLVEAATAGFAREAAPRQAHRAEAESAQDGGDAARSQASQATAAPGVHRPAPTQMAGDDRAPADAPSSTPASASSQTVAPAPAPAVDAEFEAARGTLLERLEHFEAPPGTTPEDAQQLRQELIDAVERFDPAPGQTTQEALAELHDDYDRRVEDFTQDQKIDALIQEAQRDNEAEAAAETDGETPLAVPVDAAVEDDTEASVDPTSVDPKSVDPTSDDQTSDDPNSDEPTDDRAIEVEPAEVLIGLDQPAEGGLKDDFDTMIGEAGSKSELDVSDIDAPARRSLDVNVDDDGPATPLEVTDVRATYIPPAEQPVLLGDTPADVSPATPIEAEIDSPIHLADDVLGDVSVASLVGQAEPAAVDLGEPIVVDAPELVAHLIETNPVVEIVEIVVEPIVEIEPIPTPVDDLEPEDIDFAADIASDITPAAPDTLSFEP